MIQLRHLLSATLAACFLLSALHAQVPAPSPTPRPHLAGDYDLLTPDGTKVGEIEITLVTGTDYLSGRVFDNNGKEIVGEALAFTPDGNGNYTWENARGRTGRVDWDPVAGEWVSVVGTGPHAGTTRHLDPH